MARTLISSGEEYHPGLEPGSEIGWSALAGPDPSVQSAENGQVVRTRPLCPYPLVARYQGSGSIDDAANFACVKP